MLHSILPRVHWSEVCVCARAWEDEHETSNGWRVLHEVLWFNQAAWLSSLVVILCYIGVVVSEDDYEVSNC